MILNLNKALPIKDYADTIAKVRGYYSRKDYIFQSMYYSDCDDTNEIIEMNDEFERIKNSVDTLDKLMEFTHGEESNYWSQTGNFYYWTRFNPTACYSDYCIHIKVYRK